MRLLPHACTLLSNPLGCEVFQKQKVILLQSRKGCFRQPAGKMHQHYSNSKQSHQKIANPLDSKIQRLAISTSSTHQHPPLPSAPAHCLLATAGPILPATRTLLCHHGSTVAAGQAGEKQPPDPLHSGERECIWAVGAVKCQAGRQLESFSFSPW